MKFCGVPHRSGLDLERPHHPAGENRRSWWAEPPTGVFKKLSKRVECLSEPKRLPLRSTRSLPFGVLGFGPLEPSFRCNTEPSVGPLCSVAQSVMLSFDRDPQAPGSTELAFALGTDSRTLSSLSSRRLVGFVYFV